MPDGFARSSTDTISRSPALNAPSSQSAVPRRAESCFSRARKRSSTSGRRSLAHGLSGSNSLAAARSRIGGSVRCGGVEHDRARLEQSEVAILVRGNLAEWMEREMRRLFHRAERDEADFVGLADFFERPANARVASEALAAVGGTFERGDGDGHRAIDSSIAMQHVERLVAANRRGDGDTAAIFGEAGWG